MSVLFNANKEELSGLKKYYDSQKSFGLKEEKIIIELFSQGWTKKELSSILPNQIEDFFHKRFLSSVLYLIFLIGGSALLFLQPISFSNLFMEVSLELLSVVAIIIAIKKLSILTSLVPRDKVISRRIILFFNRLDKIFGIHEIKNKWKQYENIRNRNPRKIFLPVKESYQYKLFCGEGEYKGKKFIIYIVKKYSHTVKNTSIYKYFIFYEFKIKPVPFYYSIVKEYLFEAQSKRLQNKNFKKGDFKDIDFAARQFNKSWKLRGSDKKMAYQIFQPQMMSLIMKIHKQDFIGLEISDQSVILSNLFTRKSINRSQQDLKIVYEIARQIERNYRG